MGYYDERSWTAWLVGMLSDGIIPVALLVLAGLFVWRGGRPRQGGLRFVGGALALWAITDLLAWPSQSRFVYDTVYSALGPWFGENYGAISGLIGTFFAAVCLALGGYGTLVVVNDVAKGAAPATAEEPPRS